MIGITTQEARCILLKNGANELPEEKLNPIYVIFFQQFMEPLICILFVSAIISFFLKEYIDTFFIFFVVFVNAIIGTIQEYGANKSAQSLKKMVEIKTFVIRDGIKSEIPARELVVSDYVVLEEGSKVPADIILKESKNLKVDESMLTGESLPVDKNHNETKDDLNKIFAGTIIIKGFCSGVVVNTGLGTEIGKIAEKVMQKSEANSPLVERMDVFTKKLTIIMAILIIIISIISFINGISWRETLMLATSLGVAAIPEGLPIAVTICLAIGMNRMAKKNVIVKNLTAVESLGSCTIIASDKTGTLTINQMSVVDILTPTQQISPLEKVKDFKLLKDEGNFNTLSSEKKIIISFVSSNEATKKGDEFFGDPVDIALLRVATDKGYTLNEIYEKYKKIDIIPYTSETKYSVSFNTVDDDVYAFVKGAPETVVEMCNIDQETQKVIKSQLDKLSSGGLRVLAVACGKTIDKKIENLEFLCLLAMLDPLRTEVKQAIKDCNKAGIKITMITGDNPKTAFAIAKELGITKKQEEVRTGNEIEEAKNINKMNEFTKNTSVYARVKPIQKLDIVKSMQENGNYVAVTGDGVNDAPALKNANVGIAMGKKGTDIARESANIILADDNFTSIIYGIEEGRLIYSNIRKIVFFLMSTAFAEIGIFLLSMIFKMPIPFTPIQLLWVNLVTESIQGIALAMEGKDGTEMSCPPRKPTESIFDRVMIFRIILSSIVIITGCFITYKYFYDVTNDIIIARSSLLFLLIMFTNMQIFNARSETKTLINNFFRNPFLLLSILLITLLHVLVNYVSIFSEFFSIVPLTKSEISIVLPVSLLILFFGEIEKFIRKKLIH